MKGNDLVFFFKGVLGVGEGRRKSLVLFFLIAIFGIIFTVVSLLFFFFSFLLFLSSCFFLFFSSCSFFFSTSRNEIN